MDLSLVVARLRRSLKSLEKSLGFSGILGLVYRRLLPESIRANILTREYQDRYGERTSYQLEIGNKEILFSTRDQFSKKWFFPRCDNRIHEPVVTRHFAKLARSSDGIMDIGANLGWFTCIGAVLSEGMTYSFEMDEDNVRRLRSNVKLNDQEESVCVERLAVSNHTAGSSYSKLPGEAGSGYRLSSTQEDGNATCIEVPSTTVDVYCRDQVEKLDLIKVDVEGAELKVLEGAQNTLQQFRPDLLLEVHPVRMHENEESAHTILRLLVENGYTVRQLVDHRGDPKGGKLQQIEYPFAPSKNLMLYATHD